MSLASSQTAIKLPCMLETKIVGYLWQRDWKSKVVRNPLWKINWTMWLTRHFAVLFFGLNKILFQSITDCLNQWWTNCFWMMTYYHYLQVVEKIVVVNNVEFVWLVKEKASGIQRIHHKIHLPSNHHCQQYCCKRLQKVQDNHLVWLDKPRR